MAKQTRYSMAFRERAVRRMKLGDNVSKLARELGVDRTCLYMWKRKLEKRRHRRSADLELDWRDDRIEELEAKIARLERIIGGQSSELDFFESALRRVDEKARKSGNGAKAYMPRSVPGCNRKAN
jgi:transposase-like protein